MFFFIGFAAGAITGVPIGPVNVAVIDAAYRHTLRRALAVAVGGAFADFVCCALGVAGVTPLLNANPSVPPILYLISGIILFFYGLITVRSRPVTPAANEAPRAVAPSRDIWSGLSTGLLLILLNPAAVLTWLVIMGNILPAKHTLGDGLAAAVGVFVGSLGWFSFVAYLTQRGKSTLGDKAKWLPRVVGVALIGYSIYLIVRAAIYFI